MYIRRAGTADAAAIARVSVDTWRTTYRGIVPQAYLDGLTYARSENSYARILSDPVQHSAVFVAEATTPLGNQDENNAVVGFAALGPEREGNALYRGEVYAIYVLNAYQKHHLGRRLITQSAAWLRQCGYDSLLIWVLRDNPSRGFYERLGGVPIAEKSISIGNEDLIEIAYGWTDMQALINNLASPI